MRLRNLYLTATGSIAFFSIFCGNTSSDKAASLTSSAISNDSSIHPTGAIAYVKLGGSEIRLIDSNGKNDHLLWTHPDAKDQLGVHDLAWRPDGKELAFSSAHEALFSVYDADLYVIRPDGSGFRKITNPPDHSDFVKYKTGSVTVTVTNNQYGFIKTQASSGVFFVNIVGADQPQMVTIPPGASKTLVFKTVSDFGKRAQALVAIYGNYRWFMPGTDVEAGKNVKAPNLVISGDGIEYFGAFRPVWKQDGSMLSYRTGSCLVQKVPARSTEGALDFLPMFSGHTPMGSCTWDYGPTPALADQVLYTENSGDGGSGIFLTKEGGTHDPATRITLFSDIQYQLLYDLKWLPDGSGFIYSTVNLFRDAANIFWYDIRSKQTKQVTQLQGAFARKFSISPSGKQIVYEHATTADEDDSIDLWIIGLNGKGDRLLVKNACCPSWSK